MKMLMRVKVAVLFLAAVVMLISLPSVLCAADIEVNGSVQVNGPGNQILFPDASALGGTEQVKFIIALSGIFPSQGGSGVPTPNRSLGR